MDGEKGKNLVELAKVYASLGQKDSQGRKYVRGLIDLLNPNSVGAELDKRIKELEEEVSRLKSSISFRGRE